MEVDWQEVARIGLPPPGPHSAATPVAALAFDTNQELLWAGNEYGRVTSFYGPDLQRYTSLHGNSASDGPVQQILLCERGVLSIGNRSIHFSERRGRTLWHITRDVFQDLRCVCFTAKGSSEVLVAGCQDKMFRIDTEKGDILETLLATDQYTILKRAGQYICAATSSGSVELLDPKSFKVIKSWKAHMGWINDLDANSSFLVTCGCSPRQQYGPMFDPLAKVFDLKTLMPLPPVPFHAGAAFVRMHPRMHTTGVIGSQNGQLQVVDIMNSSMVNVRQINLVDSYLMNLEIAPSGEALALTDTQCCIHLWGSTARIHFSDFSNPTDFAETVGYAPNVDWSPSTPLSTIGMPHYREVLLSAWPGHMVSEVGAPPIKIDPSILASLTRTEFGAYAPNPRKTRRNQVEDTRSFEKAVAAFEGPKFLSEQAKNGHADEVRRISDALEILNTSEPDGSLKIDVPIMYRNVEIKYSRFGVDDFDFEYYNKTHYSGLETHIANSYANSLLQLLKFTPTIRNLALHHTSTPCLFETCLLCEMGFLFDMLEKANGQNCQATNFLKAFSSQSQAASLGLLEETSPTRPLTQMIQSANAYLLEKIAQDWRQVTPQPSTMDQALTTVHMLSLRCAHCQNETIRQDFCYYYELIYPPRTPQKSQGRHQPPTFSQILKSSVERHEHTRGYCDRCKRYQQLGGRRNISMVPPVLMINAAVHSTEGKQLWSRPRWLPQEIGIIVEQGQFFCYEGADLRMHLQRGVFNIIVYELIGIVADISSGENQKPHLVSTINVSPSLREMQTENNWHLFNDFLVRKITDEEALRFPPWKLPSVLSYQRKDLRHSVDDSWKDRLDTSILYRRWSLRQDDDPSKFKTLSLPSERPRAGTAVGIDAEFVALQQEELEIRPDGSRSTLRPSRLALARVSVLRGGPGAEDHINKAPGHGQHPSEENNSLNYIPFIDDYIQILDPITDYLTTYSGISPGDLDPKTSPYTGTGRLVSLKTAYKKIWLLLNLGCIFVGHGLPKDFRTINIHIPRAQVVDTVDLFFIKARQRKLSLRFLSWYLLGEVVQQPVQQNNEGEGILQGHDSVEDARMALKLWGVWKTLEAEGKTEQVVEEIYRRGRDLGFKVPIAVLNRASRGRPQDAVGFAADSRSATPVDDSIGRKGGPKTPVGRSAGLVSKSAVIDSPLK